MNRDNTHEELTNEDLAILTAMSKLDDPHTTPGMIAQDCGHSGDALWASERIARLVILGKVEDLQGGWFEITEAGREALHAKSPPPP